MVASACPEDEFIDLFKKYGPRETARKLNIGIRRVFERRNRWELRNNRPLVPPPYHTNTRVEPNHSSRINFNIEDGIVLVGSDAHYWPGQIPPAHQAFLQLCKDLSPRAVIMNGDVTDLSSISKHPPIGWEKVPTVVQEIETAQERLAEIEQAVPRGTKLIWPLGNHDSRFSTRLATVAAEYARIHGTHLKDHFPAWEPCWATWINDDVVVKHRFKGGIHATHNNALWAGKTIITGHLHSLKVTPLNDYNGIRFGVDTGCIADPDGQQFVDYTEDNPKNWRSGFVVLTFRKGRLMWPEVVHVGKDGRAEFRGDFIEVSHAKVRAPKEEVRMPKTAKRSKRVRRS